MFVLWEITWFVACLGMILRMLTAGVILSVLMAPLLGVRSFVTSR